MAHSQNISVRVSAAEAFSSAFPHLTNKEQAWEDLLALVKEEDIKVRLIVALALGLTLPHIVDIKKQAIKDLQALEKDGYIDVRFFAVFLLGLAFPYLTVKEQVTKDMFALVEGEDFLVKDVDISIRESFALVYSHVTNQEQVWNVLLDFVKGEDIKLRRTMAKILVSASPHLIDKEQAWKDLLVLLKDEDLSVRGNVARALGSTFPHLADKGQATKDLLALVKDEDISIRGGAAMALGLVFPHLIDKEQAWKVLFALVKDEDISVQVIASLQLGSVFPLLTNKEQAMKDLLALAKDRGIRVRWIAANPLSSVAMHYISEKDFKKAFQCFSEASSAFKRDVFGYINPDPEFYLYKGFGYYCQSRELMSELPEKEPEEYVKNIKKAVRFLNRSIKHIHKSGSHDYENETRLFPICLNIYSALYEYNLSYLKFDKKRFVKIEDYLENASAQCKIAGTQQGEDLVTIVEKLTSSLKIFLVKVEQENKKYSAAKKGKGGGWDAKYKSHIDKRNNDFIDSLVEIDNALNKLDAPLFKKIAMIERECLENIQSSEPKTSWQRLYKIIHDFIKRFWKMIAGIGVILTLVVGIITIWQFIAG